MDEHSDHEVHAHEGTDVHVRPLVLFFVIFLVIGALSFVIVKWSYGALVKFENSRQHDKLTLVQEKKAEIPPNLELRAGGPAVTTLPASGTLLQPDPVRDMNAMRASQLEKLNSYGWIDRDRGIVHVPIEKAMAIAIERSMVRAQSPAPAAMQAPVAPAGQSATAPAAR